MTIQEMIRQHAKGKGEDTMWESVRRISEFVEAHKESDHESYEDLKKDLYSMIVGCHFDENWGRKQIAEMFFVDDNGKKHYGPFWTDGLMASAYERVGKHVPNGYSEWDFYVTLNMMYADFVHVLEEWFKTKSAEDLLYQCSDMAVAWMDDPDSQYADGKVWCYFE